MFKIFALTQVIQAVWLPEQLRDSQGSGLAFTLSNNGLNYLKTYGLPYIYNSISDIQIPD